MVQQHYAARVRGDAAQNMVAGRSSADGSERRSRAPGTTPTCHRRNFIVAGPDRRHHDDYHRQSQLALQLPANGRKRHHGAERKAAVSTPVRPSSWRWANSAAYFLVGLRGHGHLYVRGRLYCLEFRLEGSLPLLIVCEFYFPVRFPLHRGSDLPRPRVRNWSPTKWARWSRFYRDSCSPALFIPSATCPA